MIRISSLQKSFLLDKSNEAKLFEGQEVEVKLFFYLYGIRALVTKITENSADETARN
jgi:hypothetical protein